MPKVSDFKKTHTHSSQKRRPGRDQAEFKKISNEGPIEMSEENSNIKVVDVDKKQETTASESSKAEASSQSAEAPKAEETIAPENKISIKFPGSDVIRSKIPMPFDVAEAIATDWVNDGKFDKVPVSHPLAKVAVQQSLRKVKDIEKKVLASPVTEKVAMQAFTYAMKVQGLVNEIKSKVKKK